MPLISSPRQGEGANAFFRQSTTHAQFFVLDCAPVWRKSTKPAYLAVLKPQSFWLASRNKSDKNESAVPDAPRACYRPAFCFVRVLARCDEGPAPWTGRPLITSIKPHLSPAFSYRAMPCLGQQGALDIPGPRIILLIPARNYRLCHRVFI